MPLSTLYLCYFGLREPLVQTQVLPYLRQLTAAGIQVHLLTFEPELRARWTEDELTSQRSALAGEGISWFYQPYHKSPSAPATIYDIMAGARFIVRLVRREDIHVLHARAHVPMAMVLLAAKVLPRVRIIFDIRGLMSKVLPRVRIIFDIRGLMAEEYEDAGIWRRDSLVFRGVKKLERKGIRRANGIVVLTERMRDWLVSERLAPSERIEVIPCCVDVSRYRPTETKEATQPLAGGRFEVVYAGSVTGLYMMEEMARFFVELRARRTDAFFRVLTMSSPEQTSSVLVSAGVSKDDFEVSSVAADQVPDILRRARLGISFRKPTFSQIAASPTKIGEYLAAGLPIVSNRGIGDVDELLEKERIGILVKSFDPDALALAAEGALVLAEQPDISARCRAAAQKYFDLYSIGGTRYRNAYSRLVTPPA